MKRTYLVIALLCTAWSLSAKTTHCPYECEEQQEGIDASRFSCESERRAAYQRRVAAACLRTLDQAPYNIECENNGDQEDVADFAANFSKTLPHNAAGTLNATGLMSYETMLDALTTGHQDVYNGITLAPGSVRKLVSPQGSATFSFLGTDSSLKPLALFPKLDSLAAVAQMTETYLNAVARDVIFSEYGTGAGTDVDPFNGGSITNNAATALNSFGAAYKGPAPVTAANLFRGINEGTTVGPYISQFLYHPLSIPAGAFPPSVGLNNLDLTAFETNQQYPIAGPRNFGITEANFAAIQNGTIPEPYQMADYSANKRYIITGRDLGSYVHFDLPYQPYFNAVRIMLAAGFPFAPNSPYNNGTMLSEEAFVNFGPVDVLSLLAQSSNEAAKAAWAHKWRAQRVLRPEALAGLIHYYKKTGMNPYGLNPQFLGPFGGIDVLGWIASINGQNPNSYFLPLEYPEGSPAHPSYPAGHAVVAGACVTIVKAFFDDEQLFKTSLQPVKPNADGTMLENLPDNEGAATMTLGGELNKLASNIAIGRNFAGVHYRADGDLGNKLGECVAIKVLQDHAATLTEETFNGFELTTFDGVRLRITATSVTQI